MKSVFIFLLTLTVIIYINRQSNIKDEVELKDFKHYSGYSENKMKKNERELKDFIPYSEYSENKMKKNEKIVERIALIHERKETLNEFKLFVKDLNLNNKDKILDYLEIDTNHSILNRIPDAEELNYLTKHTLENYEKDINYFEQLFDKKTKHLLKNYRNQFEIFLIYQDLQKK